MRARALGARLGVVTYASLGPACDHADDGRPASEAPPVVFGEGEGCLEFVGPLGRHVWTRNDDPGTECGEWLTNPPPHPTKGGVERDFSWTTMPDYVAVFGPEGDTPGYVSKYDLMNCNPCSQGVWPVVDASLKRQIGNMVPGLGYRTLKSWQPTPAKPCIPKAGEFERIYDPSVGEADRWYYNDHTFVRGKDGTWHVFAITQKDGARPEDERSLGHATSPSLSEPTWTKQPSPLAVDESLGERVLWAPHVVEHEGTYYMFYCAGGEPDRHAMRLATSTDLYTWTRVREALFEDGAYARDPFVTRIGSLWVMYYTATSEPEGGNYVIAYRTSSDLLHWSARGIAFTDPAIGTFGGPAESPFVVQRREGYYLFLSMRGDYVRTEAFFSTDPLHFELKPLMPSIPSHAAELVHDLYSGSWNISHCGWHQGGLYLAPLTWSCDEPAQSVQSGIDAGAGT